MNKEQMEKQHSEMMNKEAVERIKQETEKESISKKEADRIEKAFFEDGETIKLRDGKTYTIAPCTLKEARKLMKCLETVNVDIIILNFMPTDDPEADAKREQDLFDILLMAFKDYPHVDKDYIDNYVDLNTAREIIDTMIGLNGIKK